MNQVTMDPKHLPKETTIKKSRPRHRMAVQSLFFALIALLSLNQWMKENGSGVTLLPEASLHAICPFGGVVSIYQFVTAGTFVQKIHESSMILMGIAYLLAVLFGPVLCGWVCPLGSVQEWIGKSGRKIFKKRYNRFIPKQIDNYLRLTRYIVLFLVIYQTAATAKLMFQDVDPYYALFHFWADEISIAALIILGLTIFLSLFVERPWCKYACPYGAVLGIFNLFRVFKIRRTPSACINCRTCDRVCPMNIPVSSVSAVLNHQCISCMECTSEHACPAADTVHLSAKGRND